jgi:hypothetical protein
MRGRMVTLACPTEQLQGSDTTGCCGKGMARPRARAYADVIGVGRAAGQAAGFWVQGGVSGHSGRQSAATGGQCGVVSAGASRGVKTAGLGVWALLGSLMRAAQHAQKMWVRRKQPPKLRRLAPVKLGGQSQAQKAEAHPPVEHVTRQALKGAAWGRCAQARQQGRRNVQQAGGAGKQQTRGPRGPKRCWHTGGQRAKAGAPRRWPLNARQSLGFAGWLRVPCSC